MREINEASLLKAKNKGNISLKIKRKISNILLEIQTIREDIQNLKEPLTVQYRYLKNEDVKKILNISTSTLLLLRSSGILPFYKVKGTIYFKYDEVVEAMNNYRLHYNY
ncbi:helix-turn-helix domain-containing protein [Flavobacteriaceae bacterium]|nr:helix-turn-helix domain-containing protein [Flavobacteriaceae bacterium]